MIVSQVIEQLKKLPQDLPVILCNINDDGDGDGFAQGHEIESIFKDYVVKKNKKLEAVYICFDA